MARFKVTAEDGEGQRSTFTYDTATSTIADGNGAPVNVEIDGVAFAEEFPVSPPSNHKVTALKNIKIQLGMACNYDCGYCSQRLSRAEKPEAQLSRVAPFIAQLPSWYDGGEDGKGKGTRFEFWGGEPLVYIKILRPLAEAIRARYPNAVFFIVTNGSLLTREINAWLDEMGFYVGLSHDGAGQHVRGADPFDDPEQRDAILDLFSRLHPQDRFDFFYVLHRLNTSRAAVFEFFNRITKRYDVRLSEGELISIYDPVAEASLVMSEAEHFAYRQSSLAEILDGRTVFGNHKCLRYVNEFLLTLQRNRPLDLVPERCHTSRSNDITVDLSGNILSCQNFNAKDTTPDGESHCIGHVTNTSHISVTAVKHWNDRPACRDCPMIQLCNGACMVTTGSGFEATCDNRYSDSVVYFCTGFFMATGFMPIIIEREDGRKIPYAMTDIFGRFPDMKTEAPRPRAHRTFQIKQVN